MKKKKNKESLPGFHVAPEVHSKCKESEVGIQLK